MELVQFDKITRRISSMCASTFAGTSGAALSSAVDPRMIAAETIRNIYDGISTEELDMISVRVAENHKLEHPDYSILASRIRVSNMHKNTPGKFSEAMEIISKGLGTVSSRHMEFIRLTAQALDPMIVHERDYDFDNSGYMTLEKSYLIKIGETQVDRPQYMFMRAAIAVNLVDEAMTGGRPGLLEGSHSESVRDMLASIQQCYNNMSLKLYTHATPTLFNSCMKRQQLMSCFLLGIGDSAESIMDTAKNTALISKRAGGIGIHYSTIRSTGQHIHSTNGKSSGIVPQLRIFNDVARCFDQGSKRLGAFAIYLEPWHADILQYLELKMPSGEENKRARDLFYALWVPDLFMARVEADTKWSLFSEDTAPGLSDVYDGMPVCQVCRGCVNEAYNKYVEPRDTSAPCGRTTPEDADQSECDYAPVDAFTMLYERYEGQGRAVREISARKITDAICLSQRMTGGPYMCYKDTVNRGSNQQNIGTIKSSNLCSEIMEVSSEKSYACCTLASINVRRFLVGIDKRTGLPALAGTPRNEIVLDIDHEALHRAVRTVARSLDRVIDSNDYPVEECRINSLAYRPIGIGIQGTADLFCEMRVPFVSEEAARIENALMETIYHAAITESCARARRLGPYSGFAGSPASRGLLQPHLYMIENKRRGLEERIPFTGRYNWQELTDDVREYGLRNSLHTALMPTVSTSQIFGNNESFEPYHSNIYTRTTLSGKHTVVNGLMIRHLIELGLWSADIRDRAVDAQGSIQDIEEIPKDVREIYKTVWEIKQLDLINRAAWRGAWVDQSQSLNIFVRDSSANVLWSVMQAGYKRGLKTGSYYIRTRPATTSFRNNVSAVRARTAQAAKAESAAKMGSAAPAASTSAVESALPEVCYPGCDSCSA